MTFKIPPLDELLNESDVEQKLIFPLLSGADPFGLNIPTGSIQTKKNIRRLPIGKGTERKVYFPDYLIVLGGLPLVVIEAKKPSEGVLDGYREARLYAAELNAIFPSGINPLTKILVTNGHRLLAGPADHAEPQIDMPHSDLGPYTENMAALRSLIGRSVLENEFLKLCALTKPERLWKPRRLVGGISIQQGEVGHNSFGATISADFAHIFNPVSREDRSHIAKHGYIPSRRRERYIDPIDRVIRASRPPSEMAARPIEDTGKPTEVINALSTARPLEHQVLLIVGGVGVGKSTFIDYLQDVALPRELIVGTVWVRVNMNTAPISTTEIYDWLRKEIVSGCRAAYADLDFDELSTMQAIYSVEVNQFKKGIGRLYVGNELQYNTKLAEHLEKVTANLHQQAIAHTRYCATERKKLLILVLDNCDKRLRDEQLLMFQAAQWVQKEFRVLVVLPLREETYDNHRHQPPLDTALKDLVFRIEPPLFHNILVRRVQLALNEIIKSGVKTFRYNLPNGFHVDYAASDQAYYFTSILRAIFEYDRYVRRMIVGLSGRSIRRALEMFLEFCTSGHIGEDQIFRIRQSEGNHVLPLHLVVRVLLRMNRRFYDSDYSYMKNVFSIDHRDTRPNYFSRLIILRWLLKRFSFVGPSGLKGYFPVRDLLNDLANYGVDDSTAHRELEYLATAQCIISEDFRIESLTPDDLIRLGPAGFVHLEMLNSVDYIAAAAEDTWFDDENTAREVASRIKRLEQHYQPDTAVSNARDLLELLQRARDKDAAASKAILDHSSYEELTDFSDAVSGTTKLERSLTPAAWVDVAKKFPVGARVVGIVVNCKPYGLFVELEPGVTGLMHSSKLPSGFEFIDYLSVGERVTIEILSIDGMKQRIEMAFVDSPDMSVPGA